MLNMAAFFLRAMVCSKATCGNVGLSHYFAAGLIRITSLAVTAAVNTHWCVAARYRIAVKCAA